MSAPARLSAVLVGAVVIAGCAPPEPEPAPPPPPVPTLDGTFRLTLSAGVGDTGAKQPDTAGEFDLVIRSACSGDQFCVATATAPEYDDPKAIPPQAAAVALVFDYVDGRWVAVRAQQATCREDTGEAVHDTYVWRTYTLEQADDGSWSGDYVERNALDSCGGSTRQEIQVTRTGPADPGITLPDPASEPPRVVTPAAGFEGTYTSTLTAKTTKRVEESAVYLAETTCLRTGDRCLSYLVRDDGPTRGSARKLVFADGHWTETSTPIAGECPGGGRYSALNTSVVPMPAAPGNPIAELAGSFTQRSAGECTGVREYDVAYSVVLN